MTGKYEPYTNKINELNKALDATINLANNTLNSIEKLENSTLAEFQNRIDDICVRLSDDVNEKLDKKRADVIICLHDKYVKSQEIVALLKPIVEAKLSDLSSVISVLTNVIKLYAGPYATAVEEIAGVASAVAPSLKETSDRLTYLAVLPSQIPVPENTDINFNKLNISMKPITIDNIITGDVS